MASHPCGLLALEGEAVRDHGDEFRIGGFSLDIADRVAEELLQHLDVASIPGHLDGVADFRDLRPEFGGALRRIVEVSQPLD